MHVTDTGFWDGDPTGLHHHDESLCAEISAVLKERQLNTLLDLGCGDGQYVRAFESQGMTTTCCDGNPLTADITNGKCFVANLAHPLDLQQTFQCVLSLEVGEHIPQAFESTFIDNVVRHAERFIILSWAVPQQGGHGHFNEQPNEYIAARLAAYGFGRDEELEARLRHSATQWWFKNTLMVFVR